MAADLTATQMEFIGRYQQLLIKQEKAKGMSGPALVKFIADQDEFKRQYANPL